MIAKIIIGFFALTGFIDTIVSIITLMFPKSKAAKFIFRNFGIKYNTQTYERID